MKNSIIEVDRARQRISYPGLRILTTVVTNFMDSIMSQLSLEQQLSLFYAYVHIVPPIIFQVVFLRSNH